MKKSMYFAALSLSLVWIITTADLSLAQKKKREEKSTRSVTGLVWDQMENSLEGAIVQIKNTRTLQIKSFITQKEGSYYFHGLDPNIDYRLTARYGGVTSRTRTLSTFDDRKKVIYNFRLKLNR